MTVHEIENDKNYELHHKALRRGYISRKTEGYVEEYNGRFGKGYIALTPRFDTTQYITISYYIKRD